MTTAPVNETERKLEIVVKTGLMLASSTDLEEIVQAATDAGLELCGAQFGAFFYNIINEAGESYLLYTLSGVAKEKFSQFPMPRNTPIFAPTFEGTSVVRSDDITKDPRYGTMSPHYGMPQGHLPVRSYLAVPVKSQSGEVLGGLFYGHASQGVFEERSESLVSTVAAQAAIAIENVRLRNKLNAKIASQKEASKHLGELAAIVEFSEDPILTKNLDGIITSWNQAATRILGYTAEEMIGKSILTLIPPDLQSDEPIIIGKIRAGERIEHFETIRLTKNGERIDVELTISPVKDEAGTIIGASKIVRNITTRKRMERSLLQAEKIAATGRMAATIAHEINNPLEAVVNLLYLLRPEIKDPVSIGYLDSAETELTRVSHIAKQTLGYYKEHATASRVTLSSVAEHAYKIYEPRCNSVGIAIRSNFASDKKLTFRRGEMMQVISNLIANSIYAMPNGGELRIEVTDVSTPAPGVTLTIEDTGMGIPQENLSRVFDAFFTTRATIGTGIGLFVARQFVEGHGGCISLKSSTDAESHGTRVTIFLPTHTTYEQQTQVESGVGSI